MRVDVIGRGIEVTDAIRTYADQKAGKLTKYYDGPQLVPVPLPRASAHHNTDFDVELVLDVEKHDDFVSHAKGPDVYAAIDIVLEKGERQLRDFKEKLKQSKH